MVSPRGFEPLLSPIHLAERQRGREPQFWRVPRGGRKAPDSGQATVAPPTATTGPPRARISHTNAPNAKTPARSLSGAPISTAIPKSSRFSHLAPEVGLEPTTLRLTAGCSAIELLRNCDGGMGGSAAGQRPTP